MMMNLLRALGLATLMLGVILLTGGGSGSVQAFDKDKDKDDDDVKEIKAAQKDVLEMVKDVEGGKDISAKAAAIKKKYDELNTVMNVYKPTPKHGIGYLPPGTKPHVGDGLELKIIALGKRMLPKATLQKEKETLIKAGYINLAMAEVARKYVPSKVNKGKGPKDWNGHVDDMKKASQELIAAAKAGDPVKVKDAATNLNSACNNCHSDFRDNP